MTRQCQNGKARPIDAEILQHTAYQLYLVSNKFFLYIEATPSGSTSSETRPLLPEMHYRPTISVSGQHATIDSELLKPYEQSLSGGTVRRLVFSFALVGLISVGLFYILLGVSVLLAKFVRLFRRKESKPISLA
ncbi:hypothetical protein B9G98_00170 [Wickerhamiella sorbophila]|uniref:Uncharacterized protein n=1 Tax=Wickerhamiella sorbophila TaxID=45607 RepID=A0A2T0FC58_9ASCO|nr:hypothetical protein B9G98_00170 [Wickerhamiella sorbophila]PRT52550.1 hypothetical protein B9G98_00170 [Wickerhamiella sorbophila]